MRSNTVKRSLILGSVLAGALTLGVSTTAASGSTADTDDRTRTAVSTTEKAPSVETERGIVLEGTGSWQGQDVMVTVYENQRYGNSVQLVVGDPDAGGAIGYVESTDPFVVDGELSVEVEVDGRTAVLAGTVTEAGRPERIHDALQDGGEQINSRGTHTALAVDATLELGGAEAALTFSPAFAYDLEVQKVALYGN